MEIKRNQATRNRPKGDRIIDAPVMVIDLHQSANQIKEEKTWQKNDRNGLTIFKTTNLAIVLVSLKAGAEINDNVVDGIITVKVISGEIRIVLPGEEITANENELIILHPGIEHSLIAKEESTLLLTSCTE